MSAQLTIEFDAPPTQTDTILRHLRYVGPITPIEALNLYGCFRLAARVKELRERGYNVTTEKGEANGKHFARYRLA
jgi:hypothetical protein